MSKYKIPDPDDKKELQKSGDRYSDVEPLLQIKLIEIVEAYNIKCPENDREDLEVTKLQEDLDFFLKRIKEHRENKLFKQHIDMRQNFSNSAKRFFLFYLVGVAVVMALHILGKLMYQTEIFSTPVLVTILGTVPINFIGLFAIILKDLFPKGEFPKNIVHPPGSSNSSDAS